MPLEPLVTGTVLAPRAPSRSRSAYATSTHSARPAPSPGPGRTPLDELTILTARPTPISGRCWAVTRQTRDFTDGELAIANTAQPLLVTLDRAHSPSSTRVTPHQSDLYGLTRREQQGLQYTADGFTAIQFGHLLRISPKTVRKHQQAVYAKLHSHGRVQAIRTAWTSGLLSPPSP